MLKRLISLLLIILTLLVSSVALAEDEYFIQTVPDIVLLEDTGELRIACVLPVTINYDCAHHSDLINAYLTIPFDNEYVYGAILTDGYTVVHAFIIRNGHHELYLSFETEPIQRFLLKKAYLILIATTE